MIVYALASAVIPSWAWMMRRIYRQPPPVKRFRHAATVARPHPLKQRHRGARVRPRTRPELLPGALEVTA